MSAKRPIVLVHGLWVTPHCWDKFRSYYESRGHQVLAPAWPGVTDDAAGMRRDASSLHGVGAEQVIAHYAEIIKGLPEPPIIMGHSYGGVITQVLIDRGFGAAGVAIDSVPPKGILVLPVSTYLALLPAFLKPRTFKGSFLFDGLIDSIEESIEFFSPEGKPLRASVSLGLSQQTILVADFGDSARAPGAPRPPGSNPLTAASVGASLQALAASAGRSWQDIAAANGIDNPRQLATGQLIDLRAKLPRSPF